MKGLFLCSLCLLGLLAGCGGGGGGGGDLPGPGTQRDSSRRIVFDSPRYNDSDIYTMAPDGTDWVRLTTSPEREWMPRWSPDRTKIAFFRYRPDPSHQLSGNLDLWIMQADGTGQRKIRTGPPQTSFPQSLAWSPDGNHLAYAYNFQCEVVTVNEPSNILTKLNRIRTADWSPVVNWGNVEELFVTRTASDITIAITNSIGGINRVIAEPTTVTEDNITRTSGQDEPQWSPDGSAVVFAREYHPRLTGVYIVKRDGTGLRQISTGRAEAPSWSPDGQEVVFLQPDWSGGTEVYTVRADGSGKRLIAGIDARIQHLDW